MTKSKEKRVQEEEATSEFNFEQIIAARSVEKFAYNSNKLTIIKESRKAN